jgi:oligopeptide/dipeptide ABC transporter ATP-binding protein
MQQRVMTAMALAAEPKLLIADEPTTALDATIQAQILELLATLKKTLGMSLLMITHNLGIVTKVADRVAVVYAGQIVEQAPVAALLRNPRHPYTRALIDSVPRLGSSQAKLRAIPGAVPRIGRWPSGCRFHPRCPISRPSCAETAPELLSLKENRIVRCPWHEDLPDKVP